MKVAQAIAQHLKQSGRLKHYSVVVKYVDGTVWLQGQVCSPEQARIAVNLAGEAECVEGVVNDLTIVAGACGPAGSGQGLRRSRQYSGRIRFAGRWR